MQKCQKCGASNAAGAKYCSSCGAQLIQAEKPEGTNRQNNAQAYAEKSASEKEALVRKMFRFSSQDETLLASIGNSFIENFLAGGKVSQTIAALTDKRLYYHGQTLTGNGLKVSKMTEDGSVMVKDITYTGFVHRNQKWMKIVAIVLLAIGAPYSAVGLVLLCFFSQSAMDVFISLLLFAISPMPGLLFLFNYKRKRTSFFLVRYAGGGLMFNVNLYPLQESEAFQDALNRAVDAGK